MMLQDKRFALHDRSMKQMRTSIQDHAGEITLTNAQKASPTAEALLSYAMVYPISIIKYSSIQWSMSLFVA